MSTQPKALLTAAEYLATERAVECRSEYLAGEVFAMAGTSRAHNLISLNLAFALRQKLAGKGCQTYMSDMRVGVPAARFYTYPDVLTVCGEELTDEGDPETLLNPVFIGEVLSPTTEAYDRGRKFGHYRQIPTLREYMLVAQDRRDVDLFTRQENGIWIVRELARPAELVELPSLGCSVTLAELYEGVNIK